jgi:hypothetical protein
VRKWASGSLTDKLIAPECRCFVDQSQKECSVKVEVSVATGFTLGLSLLTVLGTVWYYGCRFSSWDIRVSELRRGMEPWYEAMILDYVQVGEAYIVTPDRVKFAIALGPPERAPPLDVAPPLGVIPLAVGPPLPGVGVFPPLLPPGAAGGVAVAGVVDPRVVNPAGPTDEWVAAEDFTTYKRGDRVGILAGTAFVGTKGVSLPPLGEDLRTMPVAFTEDGFRIRTPKKAPDRPTCQCMCGCRRRPGRRIHCSGCGRLVGPGCCWRIDAGLCHECERGLPEPDPEPREALLTLPADESTRSVACHYDVPASECVQLLSEDDITGGFDLEAPRTCLWNLQPDYSQAHGCVGSHDAWRSLN